MKKIKKLLKSIGPGFITGASDDDPSGIATYSQTGALFGYNQLWTALFSAPFQVIIQEICGRIGMVTGKGLAGVIRHHYSKKILYVSVFILLIANTINIGADLGAMASSAQLLFNLPFSVFLILITAISLILEVFVSYHVYSKILKYLAFTLLAYIATAFLIKQNWGEILHTTLIPTVSFSKNYLMNIVAVLGTTISPYLFFWQASEEVEEEVDAGKLRSMGAGVPRINKRDVDDLKTDTTVGMLFSNMMMFFIILTAASTLGRSGITDIETAHEAALALKPLAGNFAYLLFALGIIGTGFLAIPILAGSASYAFSEAFGWKEGLYRKFTKAHGFYGVITVATVLGLLINFTSITPFKMLYYTAILNGICAPPLMVVIILISNNGKVMGKYTNSKTTNYMGIFITAVMSVSAFALVLSLLGVF